jgi:hypothetical protein
MPSPVLSHKNYRCNFHLYTCKFVTGGHCPSVAFVRNVNILIVARVKRFVVFAAGEKVYLDRFLRKMLDAAYQ